MTAVRLNIIQNIQNSRKYKAIYYKTIERVVDDCIFRFGIKRAEKEARNLLHQIWGAYFRTRPNFKKLIRKVYDQLDQGLDKKSISLELLKLQSSSRERISIFDKFYIEIFKITGKPASIIDHGCGLNPLSILWMDLPESTKYQAYDIDIEEVDFLRDVLKLLKLDSQAEVDTGDVLLGEFQYADVVFLFKLLPCLEHQSKDYLKGVLAQKCKFLVISYPVWSLSGKGKGMNNFYTSEFLKQFGKYRNRVKQLQFQTEMVFIVEK
ncbi:MAG: hypothetical protein PHS44_02335 [Candidatus Dojkabacteria bacterium]|nr:hypothetical protein [Candidatus Dojkabacteria bacterium]